MAAYDTTRHTASPMTSGFARALTALVSGVSTWNDARVTRKSLSQLSAHELDDIGLSRGDIDAVARRTYR